MKNNTLVEVIIKIGNNPKLLDGFLLDILTPAEYREIKHRWEIIKMLDSGISQHEIVKKLKVGIATVTRGSRVIKKSKIRLNKILH